MIWFINIFWLKLEYTFIFNLLGDGLGLIGVCTIEDGYQRATRQKESAHEKLTLKPINMSEITLAVTILF